jgi:catechol 2,3-dioxygenase-like lactoylglutathione lyase family enzyme
VIPVHDMSLALGFYRDSLGFPVVGKVDEVWTVVDAKGMRLTLFLQPDAPRIALGVKGEDSPFYFHVRNFVRSAAFLKTKGFRVRKFDVHQGIVWDPSGNVLGLHDHRKTRRTPRAARSGSSPAGAELA